MHHLVTMVDMVVAIGSVVRFTSSCVSIMRGTSALLAFMLELFYELCLTIYLCIIAENKPKITKKILN